MIRLTFIACLLVLTIFSNAQPVWAWYHAHHQLSVQTSYQQVPAHCRALFDYGGLWTGSVESDQIRSKRSWFNPLINASHKNDTWRITASYKAALEAANNPSLSSRRVARSFHYIMDQSEAEDNLRNHLQRATGIDTRVLGYDVLREIAAGTNLIFSQNYDKKIKIYSGLTMGGVEEAVTDLRRYFNDQVTYATKNLHQPADAKRFLAEVLSYYFTSIIALQNRVMAGFCAEAPRQVQSPPTPSTPPGDGGGPVIKQITLSGGLNPIRINQEKKKAEKYGCKVSIQGGSVTVSLQPNSHGPGGRAVITKNVTHTWYFTYSDGKHWSKIETITSLKDGAYSGNHASGDCSFIQKQSDNWGPNFTIRPFKDRNGVDKWNAAYDPSKKETVLFLPGHEVNEWILR